MNLSFLICPACATDFRQAGIELWEWHLIRRDGPLALLPVDDRHELMGDWPMPAWESSDDQLPAFFACPACQDLKLPLDQQMALDQYLRLPVYRAYFARRQPLGELGLRLDDHFKQRLARALTKGREQSDDLAAYQYGFLNAIRVLTGYDGETADQVLTLADMINEGLLVTEAMSDSGETDDLVLFVLDDETFAIAIAAGEPPRAVLQHIESGTIICDYHGEARQAWAAAIRNESYARMRARHWLASC